MRLEMRDSLPVLNTPRLILREITLNDARDMFEYAQLPYIGPDAGWEPHSNISHTKEVINMFRRKKIF